MTDLSAHFFADQPVRSIERGGEPWFVGLDVCRVLKIANSRDALSRLDDYERDDVGITDAIGREQATIMINESGLYSLILRSRTPAAKAFKRWVTTEVLPAIRKTGRYEGRPASAPRRRPVALPRAEAAPRTVEYKGETWWLAADLAKLLGVRTPHNLRLYTAEGNVVGVMMPDCPDLARHYVTSAYEPRFYWIVNAAGRDDVLRRVRADAEGGPPALPSS